MTPATEHVVQAWAGNLLRLARAEKGSSRRDLAKPLGCPVCIVAKIESAACGVRPKLTAHCRRCTSVTPHTNFAGVGKQQTGVRKVAARLSFRWRLVTRPVEDCEGCPRLLGFAI
jgi:hypothetical protein